MADKPIPFFENSRRQALEHMKNWRGKIGVNLPEPVKRQEGAFLHITPKPDACKHDFQGWVELKDEEGRVSGGTTVCTKCGMDAMCYSLRMGE